MDRLTLICDHYLGSMKTGIGKFLQDRRGVWETVNIVQALVALIVTGVIGIYIAQQTVTTAGTPSQANLSAMQTNLLGAGQTGSGFIVILIIAFIGGIALAYLAGMFGGRRKK